MDINIIPRIVQDPETGVEAVFMLGDEDAYKANNDPQFLQELFESEVDKKDPVVEVINDLAALETATPEEQTSIVKRMLERQLSALMK
jgi:hypothetical protein